MVLNWSSRIPQLRIEGWRLRSNSGEALGKMKWQAAYKEPQSQLTFNRPSLMAAKSLIRGVVIGWCSFFTIISLTTIALKASRLFFASFFWPQKKWRRNISTAIFLPLFVLTQRGDNRPKGVHELPKKTNSLVNKSQGLCSHPRNSPWTLLPNSQTPFTDSACASPEGWAQTVRFVTIRSTEFLRRAAQAFHHSELAVWVC